MLSKIKIFSNDVVRPTADTSFLASKVKAVDDKINALSKDCVQEASLNPIKQNMNQIQADIIWMKASQTSTMDQFEESLRELQQKITNLVSKSSVPDAEIEETVAVLHDRLTLLNQDISGLIDHIGTKHETLAAKVLQLENKFQSIDELRSQLTDAGNPIKLTLNTHYEGELYLVKIGNSGHLHGTVKSKQPIVSTNPICSIPVPYNFSFVVKSQGSKVEIKIENSNVYFAKSHPSTDFTVSIFHIIYQRL